MSSQLQQQTKKLIAAVSQSGNASVDVKVVLDDLYKEGLITQEEVNYMNKIIKKEAGLVS